MRSESRNVPGLTLVLLTLLNLALFFIPAFIIRPFKYQSPTGLSTAIYIKQIAPLASLFLAIGVVVLTMKHWRRAGWLARSGMIVAVLFTVGAAVMVRENYFEWMFHPIQTAGFTAAEDAGLPDSDMVMAVKVGDEARAYPIREMAYHHVLNDKVGAEPIVVTY